MNVLVPIAMFGWIPLVLGLFALLPARRAVIAAFLVSWLFLPMVSYKLPGFPAYTKMTASCAGVLLGAMIFDAGRMLAFRPRWFDLPLIVWCVCPFASSLSNGLGPYDGCSATVYQTIEWGLPYLIGRIYFSDMEAMRELAVGVFLGGLVYVPLCLYEIRMSPQLNAIVYGVQAEFVNSYRFGGWRPVVFMQDGLAVAMWMTSASLVGVWLWSTGATKTLFGIGMGWLAGVLVATTVLCKSTGAIILLAVGLLCLYAFRKKRWYWPMWCLLVAVPLYMGLRTTNLWSGENMVSIATQLINKDRAASLETRLDNEDQLAAKALEQPLFGWGGWGRNRIYTDDGRDTSITDGLWIIWFGTYGLVGLISFYITTLAGAAWLWHRMPSGKWPDSITSGTFALALVLVLSAIDSLLNAMPNPIYMLTAGGLIGSVAVAARKSHPMRRSATRVLRRKAHARILASRPLGQDGLGFSEGR